MVGIIVTAITAICFILWFDIEGKKVEKRALRKLEKQAEKDW